MQAALPSDTPDVGYARPFPSADRTRRFEPHFERAVSSGPSTNEQSTGTPDARPSTDADCADSATATTAASRRSDKICAECGETFPVLWELERHAEAEYHTAFACFQPECGKSFGHVRDLQRHRLLHSDAVKRYPCKHCKTYRGKDGFKRKDHLRQHIKKLHPGAEAEFNERASNTVLEPCPHKQCPDFRSFRYCLPSQADIPFVRPSEWTGHMKSVHNESLFPCPELNCVKVAGKGYFRKRDLVKHLKKEHQRTTGFDGIKAVKLGDRGY